MFRFSLWGVCRRVRMLIYLPAREKKSRLTTVILLSLFTCSFVLLCGIIYREYFGFRKLAQLPDDIKTASGVCHSPQCIAKFESTANRPKRVPSIRHILWKSDKVSAYFARQLKTWNDIHPDWKFILWRDSDINKFVAKHYTGALDKFLALPYHIMRIDMIRYMILHRFGGVYADLDYVLVRPLDRFQKFSAVVTRETEAHSFLHYGMSKWPPPVLANPAFMMSEPQHPFFNFCIFRLLLRPAKYIMDFAGPLGLSELLLLYAQNFPASELNYDGVVFVPPSRNFYAFDGNSLNSSTSEYKDYIVSVLQKSCKNLQLPAAASKQLIEYCKDVYNLNPITDQREPVHAIHDSNKSRSSYDSAGAPEFHQHLVDIRSVLPRIVMADTVF